jgi:hypothetical protein
MLTISSSLDEPTIKAGYIFNCDYVPPNEVVPLTVRDGDLFLRRLREHCFYIPTGLQNLRSHLGIAGQDLSRRLDVRFLPVNPDLNSLGYQLYDDRTYGSILRNFGVFSAVLSGRANHPPSIRNEHAVTHPNLSGELMYEKDLIPEPYVTYSFYGYEADIRWTNGLLYSGMTVDSVVPLSGHSSYYNFGVPFCYHIVDLLDAIKRFGEVHTVSFESGRLLDRRLSALKYNLEKSRLYIEYHIRFANLTQGDTWDWDSFVEINLFPSPPSIDPTIGLFIPIQYTSPTFYGFGNVTFTGWSGSLGRLSDRQEGVAPFMAAPILLSEPTPIVAAEQAILEKGYDQLSSGRFLSIFNEAVNGEFYAIAPSSCFSAVDAFLDAESDIGVDSLQNLYKIPQIASAIPQLKEGIDLLSRLLRRDLSLVTLKELLDLVTSTHLQANFQWLPYYRLFIVYLPQMISTLRSARHTSKRLVGYGSFSFDLSNCFGRESVHLVTRSKIVLDESLLGLLSTLIDFDVLGIVPKASNLWDLIPFSFVANWFTGVGASIKRAEYSALIATVPAYFVHTYTLSSPLHRDELTSLQMVNAASEPSSLRIFRRDVTTYPPVPRDSKFGFGIPTKFPPLGTLASLLYQLIFS